MVRSNAFRASMGSAQVSSSADLSVLRVQLIWGPRTTADLPLAHVSKLSPVKVFFGAHASTMPDESEPAAHGEIRMA